MIKNRKRKSFLESKKDELKSPGNGRGEIVHTMGEPRNYRSRAGALSKRVGGSNASYYVSTSPQWAGTLLDMCGNK